MTLADNPPQPVNADPDFTPDPAATPSAPVANGMSPVPPTSAGNDPDFTPDPTAARAPAPANNDPDFTPDPSAAPAPKVEPDTGALSSYITNNFEKYLKYLQPNLGPNSDVKPNPVPQPQQRPVEKWADILQAGWQASFQGLVKRGELPDKVLPENASWAQRMLWYAGRFEGDLLPMGAGMLAGAPAGPFGAMAGAWAAPEGLRTALTMHYLRGDIQNPHDLMQRAGAIAINAGGAAVTGAAMELAGGAAGVSAVKAGFGQGAVNASALAAQVAAVSTVGPLVAGQMPSWKSFTDSAFIMGVFNIAAGGGFPRAGGVGPEFDLETSGTPGGALKPQLAGPEGAAPSAEPSGEGQSLVPMEGQTHAVLPRNTGNPVIAKLLTIYARTGIRPETVASDANTDPVLKQELMSTNTELPSKYENVVESPQDGSHVFKPPQPKMIDAGATEDMHELNPALNPEFSGPSGLKVPEPPVTPAPHPQADDIDTASRVFDTENDRQKFVELAEKSTPTELPIKSTNFIAHGESFTPEHIEDRGYADFPNSKYTDSPIIVAKVGDEHYVLDGQHRLNHQAELGAENIKAIVVPAAFAKDTLAGLKQNLSPWNPPGSGGGGKKPPSTPNENLDKHWTPTTNSKSKKSFSFDALRADLVDDTDYVRQMTDILRGDKPKIPFSQDPQELILRSRGTTEVADAFVKQPFNFNDRQPMKDTRGLPAIVKPHDPIAFQRYMVAEAALQLAKRGINTNIPLEDAKAIVARDKGEFAKDAKDFYAFGNASLKYAYDAGVLSKEAYEAMLKQNSRAPMAREPLPDDVARRGGTGVGTSAIRGVDADSERRVMSPYVVQTRRAFARIRAAETNTAVGAIVKIYDESFIPAPEGYKPKKTDDTRMVDGKLHINQHPGLMREVPVKMKERSHSPEEMAKWLEDNEIEGTPESDFDSYRPDYTPKTDTQLEFKDQGRIRRFEVPKDVADVFKYADPATIGTAAKIAKGMAHTLAFGQTHTPWFLTRHLIRQLLNAGVISHDLHIPLLSELEGMGHLMLNTEAAQMAKKTGAVGGTIVSMNEGNIHDTVLGLSKKAGVLDSMFNVIRTPLMAHKIMAELMASKIQETKDAAVAAKNIAIGQIPLLDAAKAVGHAALSPIHAVMDPLSTLVFNSTKMAAFARATRGDYSPEVLATALRNARIISYDSRQTGAKAKGFWQMVPFAKVHMQSNYKFADAFTDERKWAASLKLGLYTSAAMLLWLAQKDDKRGKGINRVLNDLDQPILTDKWEDMPQGQQVGPADEYRIGPNGQLQINNGTVYRLPRGFEVGIVGALLQRTMSRVYDKDPKAFDGFGGTLMHAILPDVIPTAAVAPIETMANKSLLFGQPIVPDNLMRVLPRERWNNSTSGTAKALSRVITAIPSYEKSDWAAPMMLDNMVRDWFGQMGQMALATVDKIAQMQGIEAPHVGATPSLDTNIFMRSFELAHPTFNDQRVLDFRDNYDSAAKTLASAKLDLKRGDYAGAMRYETAAQEFGKLGGVDKMVTQQMALVHAIDQYKETGPHAVSPDQKRQAENRVITQTINAATLANQRIQQIQQFLQEKRQ